MSLLLKAFPRGGPRRRLLAPCVLSLAVVLCIGSLPGYAQGAPAAAAGTSAHPAAHAALAKSATPCARKHRAAARKACRAAVRAREAQAAQARALTVQWARTSRDRAAAVAAAASAARALAGVLTRKACAAKKREKVERQCRRLMQRRREAAHRATVAAVSWAGAAEQARRAAVQVTGRPPGGYLIPPGSYFSYPNRSRGERMAIRNRVLATIRSTWGGPRDQGVAWSGNGTIRIATWSFNDWDVAKALVAADRRGVSVQVVAARSANRDHQPWRWLRRRLGTDLAHPSVPGSTERVSFARECRGSCRGPGGTPHAKYFLFDNVGPAQARHVVIQTSMNLTTMGYRNQWNQAQVMRSSAVHGDFLSVFQQSRLGRGLSVPYHTAALGNVVHYFFPRPGAGPAEDPVMQVLSGVRCVGATGGGTPAGRTKIRIIQYAVYGERGVWIAKRLRALWRAGCDIRLVYSVSSRPVLAVLRDPRGRGPIPMRQSVITDGRGWVTGYNHSKWMTITGAWGPSTADHLTFSGSANWSDAAFGGDEQMQLVRDPATARAHVAAFEKTWRQRTSRARGRQVAWNLRAE